MEPEGQFSQKPGSVSEAAATYVNTNFNPVPIPFRRKGPVHKGWQKLRLTERDLAKHFNGAPQNIGLLLGDKYGTTDIDLDCMEAVRAARFFLPETRMVFGRASKPASHYFYRADPPIPSRKFIDTDKSTICEFRCQKNDGTTGFQTVVPPSAHEATGEEIRFEAGCGPQPANIDADVLGLAVARTAAAALLARHWPECGHGRHDTMLALAGGLARAGWNEPDAKVFCHAVYQSLADPDPNAADRCDQEVESTFRRRAKDEECTGWPHVIKVVGTEVVRLATSWLGIEKAVEDRQRPTATVLSENWRSNLIVTREGTPKPVLANAITALRLAPEWDGVLAFNEFSLAAVARKSAPWDTDGACSEWTDHADLLTANWLQHDGILVSLDVAGQAVQAVAKDRRFHPIREYLDSLKWDGTQRVDSWLSQYLGATLNDYTAAVGSRWLVSAVARIYRPGVKADCCLILEGMQGSKKSTALKTIADPWFTDEIAELGSKDASMQTRGVWIIEIAELDSMTRGDIGKVKSFMSRSTDRFRPPYGKHLVESPRQCVFAGSVNHNNYLRDETGGRRFWPVACNQIRIEDLARDRDQLWAEAVSRYRGGAAWWLDSLELNQQAAQEQGDRYEGDPWDDLIAVWLRHPSARQDGSLETNRFFTSTTESVTMSDILTHCVCKRPELWTQQDRNRLARCLRSLGWERYQVRTGTAREWRYRAAK